MKEEIFLLLDVGTEAIKALICKKKEGKIVASEGFLEYFEKEYFEKIISKLMKKIGTPIEKKTFIVLLTLSADILKGKLITQNFKREKPERKIDKIEEEKILENVLKEAKKRISQIFSESSGILKEDLQFINFQILERKIEGYKVVSLQGYKGKNLDFRIFATFSFKFELNKIIDIIEGLGFKIQKIIHPAKGLISLTKEITDGIFLDIGGEFSQIFLARDGQLEAIDEFRMGGIIFSQALAEKLGLLERDTQLLKERYSKKELSKESSDRIREFLSFPLQDWFQGLKFKLRELGRNKLLPANFFLFGGGSLLPEIEEILESGDWEDLVFEGPIQTKLFFPRDLLNIEIKTPILNNPQSIPSILITLSGDK